jgi:biotin carboxyl carrier protein
VLGDVDDLEGQVRSDRPIQGILVLENFSGPVLQPSSSTIEMVASEAGISLRNALEHQAVFALPLWKMIGGLLRKSRHPLWITMIGVTMALLAAGFVWPVQHQVIATGTVEPVARRDLFAAVDGSVHQLHVHDGQQVAQGDLLIQIENPELENRAETLAGQIQTTAGRLASIRAVRLSNKDETNQSSRLVLEERQLESELANLRAQQEVLKLQLADLDVTSPIDGTVVAWQIERRLMGRPVNRGNLLCTVANPNGSWKLRLTVPEQNAGPIVEQARQDGSLSVRFAVANMPEKTLHASLDGLSYAARMDESGNRVIDLSATVDGDPLDSLDTSTGDARLRYGADVTAKIACGQRTLIQSWFSDVVDFVHRHILFRFR